MREDGAGVGVDDMAGLDLNSFLDLAASCSAKWYKDMQKWDLLWTQSWTKS